MAEHTPDELPHICVVGFQLDQAHPDVRCWTSRLHAIHWLCEALRCLRAARRDHDPDLSLRNWVKQAAIDRGKRPGLTTAEQRRIAELEREVRELRRANEILKAASAFFAAELDPRLPKKA
jgi:transposase